MSEGVIGTAFYDMTAAPGLIETQTGILDKAVKVVVSTVEAALFYKVIASEASVAAAKDVVRQFKPLNDLLSTLGILSVCTSNYWGVKILISNPGNRTRISTLTFTEALGTREGLLGLAAKVASAVVITLNFVKGMHTFQLIAISASSLVPLKEALALGSAVYDLGFAIRRLNASTNRTEIIDQRLLIISGLAQCAFLTVSLTFKSMPVMKPLAVVMSVTGFYSAVHIARSPR